MATLVVEDNVIARNAFASLLSDEAAEVIECGEIDEALQFARNHNAIRLIVMGYELAGGTSLNGFSALKSESPETPIVIANGILTAEAAFAALDAGAAGYLPKSMSRESVSNAIKLVMTGERFMPSLTIDGWQHVANYLQARTINVQERELLDELTPRQREVLSLLTRGASNKVIARALSLHEVTVKSHMRGIFRCLGVSSRTEAVRKALLSGIDDTSFELGTITKYPQSRLH